MHILLRLFHLGNFSKVLESSQKMIPLHSVLQAGGASNRNVLSAAILGIQEALKNSDWTTRKAASVALGEIAASSGSFLGSFKASCIRSLESCRFDKVSYYTIHKYIEKMNLQSLFHIIWKIEFYNC